SRRSGQRSARIQVEITAMTRAEKTLLLQLRRHSAAEMRTLLAERSQRVLVRTQQQTGGVLVGGGEGQHAADGDFGQRGDGLDGWLFATTAEPVQNTDAELHESERQTGQHEEPREITAGDEMVLRPVDGEILTPGRLVDQRQAVRGDRAFSRCL